ncbi:MAG: MFS transporter, partial [Candidatus Omnitrophica bacterium]|nr:MFS transporter [Candidatus Omnitrophota bacterium]
MSNLFSLILLFGLISLAGDVVYEAARSVSGPYLAILGASALAISLISGLGEFIGYGLRIVSGNWADRSRKYWLMIF